MHTPSLMLSFFTSLTFDESQCFLSLEAREGTKDEKKTGERHVVFAAEVTETVLGLFWTNTFKLSFPFQQKNGYDRLKHSTHKVHSRPTFAFSYFFISQFFFTAVALFSRFFAKAIPRRILFSIWPVLFFSSPLNRLSCKISPAIAYTGSAESALFQLFFFFS